MKILNVCAGDNIVEGAMNTDVARLKGITCFWNVNDESGMENNTFDLIIMRYAVNYVQPVNFINFMKEIYRIAKPNAIIKITASTQNSKKSMVSQPFKLHTNDIENYFVDRIDNKGGWYNTNWEIKVKFEILKKRWNNILQRWATEVYYELKVIK